MLYSLSYGGMLFTGAFLPGDILILLCLTSVLHCFMRFFGALSRSRTYDLDISVPLQFSLPTLSFVVWTIPQP